MKFIVSSYSASMPNSRSELAITPLAIDLGSFGTRVHLASLSIEEIPVNATCLYQDRFSCSRLRSCQYFLML